MLGTRCGAQRSAALAGLEPSEVSWPSLRRTYSRKRTSVSGGVPEDVLHDRVRAGSDDLDYLKRVSGRSSRSLRRFVRLRLRRR